MCLLIRFFICSGKLFSNLHVDHATRAPFPEKGGVRGSGRLWNWSAFVVASLSAWVFKPILGLLPSDGHSPDNPPLPLFRLFDTRRSAARNGRQEVVDQHASTSASIAYGTDCSQILMAMQLQHTDIKKDNRLSTLSFIHGISVDLAYLFLVTLCHCRKLT